MTFEDFDRDYIKTGRLQATLLKLKVPFGELEDMQQAVILHFLEKGFVEMHDASIGSVSNHIFVGVRNFVVDTFRRSNREPRTVVIVSKRDEDDQDSISVEQLGSTEMLSSVQDSIFLDQCEHLLAKDQGWRTVEWGLPYYREIAKCYKLAGQAREAGDWDAYQNHLTMAERLTSLEVMEFGHLLIFKLFRMDYKASEIGEFTQTSTSRISGMLNEACEFLRRRSRAASVKSAA